MVTVFFGAACKVRHHYYYGIEEKERRRKFCSEGQTEEIEYFIIFTMKSLILAQDER